MTLLTLVTFLYPSLGGDGERDKWKRRRGRRERSPLKRHQRQSGHCPRSPPGHGVTPGVTCLRPLALTRHSQRHYVSPIVLTIDRGTDSLQHNH
jgi:hypothetical protein